MALWGNDAFFGCVDRFMLPMTPEACAEHDHMDVIRVQQNGDEVINGHWTGWGRSTSVRFPVDYGSRMWRALRWANHQQGVQLGGPAAFAGAEPHCGYGAPLPDFRCRSPQERAQGVPAPRYLPTLVTEQSATPSGNMLFEVYNVTPNSVLSVYLAGAPVATGLLNPTMPCGCFSAPSTPLCGAPLLVDWPNAAVLVLFTGGNLQMRNLNFGLQLPPSTQLGSFAIQAAVTPLDLSDIATTNSYIISTL
jgi:hypothetical protein